MNGQLPPPVTVTDIYLAAILAELSELKAAVLSLTDRQPAEATQPALVKLEEPVRKKR